MPSRICYYKTPQEWDAHDRFCRDSIEQEERRHMPYSYLRQDRMLHFAHTTTRIAHYISQYSLVFFYSVLLVTRRGISMHAPFSLAESARQESRRLLGEQCSRERLEALRPRKSEQNSERAQTRCTCKKGPRPQSRRHVITTGSGYLNRVNAQCSSPNLLA